MCYIVAQHHTRICARHPYLGYLDAFNLKVHADRRNRTYRRCKSAKTSQVREKAQAAGLVMCHSRTLNMGYFP